MPAVRAVVFDVDGTLLNTFEHIVRAFEVVLPKHGVKPDREAIRLVIGKTLMDCYKALAPNGDHNAMSDLHHEVQQTPQMYALITAYDNLRETLDMLHKEQIKVAVLTNRSLHSLELIFDHIGITDLFDEIVAHEEITRPKPDPQGLLRLAEKLAVPVEQIVMVGDTPIDVDTGRNAKAAAAIGMTHGFGTRGELEDAGADYIIDSFADLPRVLSKIHSLSVN